ncbi:hypothetical protein ACMV_P2_00100 (plasmid) [Acidiphilium multivorum AIU301]|uniref:Uncharacterized protein n=1 Tax=Acidiphilium multivorum (strain DSM 11245 / JCM 8867 / NBRC 100883 / AIU 301) TaxID=926570 RepID=F0J7M3_ACIMA|nr:hypothetical protein ACMV_P2_00100 [Acidiphilium multivorum AIU301]
MQERGAALVEAANRLHRRTVHDRPLIARMPGPFIDLGKQISVDRLQVRRIEGTARAFTEHQVCQAVVGQAVFGPRQGRVASQAKSVA